MARNETGFTLIEIMVVVVIISVLIGLVAPNILGRVDEARITAAKSDIATLEQALEMYRLDNKLYPSTDQGLQALVQKPNYSPVPLNWNAGGYLKKAKLPQDPWGADYQYLTSSGNSDYELYSLGSDGREGGEGDASDIRID